MTNSSQGSSTQQPQASEAAAEPQSEAQPETPEAEGHPLAGCNPRSLDEFFNRDPLDLSKQDRAVIVTELRRQRKNWAIAEAAGATRMPRAPKVKGPVVTSLDDLLD